MNEQPQREHTFKMAPKIKPIARPAVLILLFLSAQGIFAGCAGHWGRISSSRTVTETFQAYRILPDHRYYYSGPDAYPTAIIGIHKNFTLTARFWKPVDLTPERLRAWLNFGEIRVGDNFNLPTARTSRALRASRSVFGMLSGTGKAGERSNASGGQPGDRLHAVSGHGGNGRRRGRPEFERLPFIST